MNNDADRDRKEPLIDLSPLFTEILEALRFISVGMKMLVTSAKAEQGRFFVFAGNGQEMPLQKSVNGTIRHMHNNSATAATVQLLDSNETNLLGSPGAAVALAAGAIQPMYLPFKNGLRAIVTPNTAFISLGGELN